jgi:hypothetical protein
MAEKKTEKTEKKTDDLSDDPSDRLLLYRGAYVEAFHPPKSGFSQGRCDPLTVLKPVHSQALK